MKVAYLVLAHNNPKLLKRTIQKLRTPDSDFFIHIDQKSDINQFADLYGEGVSFIPDRVKVYWGEFSQVEAILKLMRQATQAPVRYDYLMLISGADYPLKSGKYIEAFFEANRGKEFINRSKMPASGKPLSRINTLRYPSSKPVRKFLSQAVAKFGLQRDYTKYFREAFSGSTWWALSHEACAYMLRFIDENPRFVNFFENTFAPDESFFHTILGNSPGNAYIRRNLNFEDWNGGKHPAMIGKKHLELMAAQGQIIVDDCYGCGEVLMARKFADENLELLDRIDAMEFAEVRVA